MPQSRSKDDLKRPSQKPAESGMVDKIVEILSPPASPAQEKSGQKNAESQLEKLRKQGDL